MLGPLIALLGLMGLMVLWLFYTFQPKFVNRRQLFIFNNMAVGLCVVLGLLSLAGATMVASALLTA